MNITIAWVCVWSMMGDTTCYDTLFETTQIQVCEEVRHEQVPMPWEFTYGSASLGDSAGNVVYMGVGWDIINSDPNEYVIGLHFVETTNLRSGFEADCWTIDTHTYQGERK